MKKYISIAFFFCSIILATTSCSVEQPEEDVIVTEYPKSIDDYVMANYQTLTIISVSIHDMEEYEVALSDTPTTILIFDLDGNFLEEY